MPTSTSAGEIIKTFSSFTRRRSVLSWLGASLVRMWRPRIVTTGNRWSRSLLVDSLLLSRNRRPAWTMFIEITRMTTGRSMATMVAPPLLVAGTSFGLSSTVIVICYWSGVISRFLVSSMACWTGLSLVRARVEHCLLLRRVTLLPRA